MRSQTDQGGAKSVGLWDSWDLAEGYDILCCHDNCLHVSHHSVPCSLAHTERRHTHTHVRYTTLEHALKLPHCLPTPHPPSIHPLSPSIYVFYLATNQHLHFLALLRQADVQSIESFPSLKNFFWEIRDQSPVLKVSELYRPFCLVRGWADCVVLQLTL